MYKKLTAFIAVIVISILPLTSFANVELLSKKEQTYTVRILAANNKQVPLIGALTEIGKNNITMVDFGQVKSVTPYEMKFTTNQMIFSVMSQAKNPLPLRVEVVHHTKDKDSVIMSANGNVIIGYTESNGAGFISAK